jgi:acid stress-induced BolA-like protein IbaG/YrbA
MRKEEIEKALADRLNLRSPRFKLQKVGSKVSGHVISDTFRGKTDSARQRMIWDAIEAAFGADAVRQVGTLLAYTNDEWDVNLPARAG